MSSRQFTVTTKCETDKVTRPPLSQKSELCIKRHQHHHYHCSAWPQIHQYSKTTLLYQTTTAARTWTETGTKTTNHHTGQLRLFGQHLCNGTTLRLYGQHLCNGTTLRLFGQHLCNGTTLRLYGQHLCNGTTLRLYGQHLCNGTTLRLSQEHGVCKVKMSITVITW